MIDARWIVLHALCVVEHDDGSLLLSVVLRCTRRQKWQKDFAVQLW